MCFRVVKWKLKFFIFLIEIQLIYNVVLVSGIQQCDSVIHMCTCIFFSYSFPLWLLQDTEYSSLCYTVGPYCLSILFIIFKINLFLNFFIFGCVGSSLLRMGFLQLQQLLLLWALGTRASLVVAHGLSSCGSQALEHRLSSCGAQAQLLRGMWDLPGPGLEPVSPALAGGFLTTAPPGKSLSILYIAVCIC